MPALSSLIWLFAGGLLQLFGYGKWNVPATAWLAPALFLRFSRGTEPAVAALAIWLVLWAAFSVTLLEVIPVPRPLHFGITAVIAGFSTLPYLADRLITPGLQGFASTLVFPMAWVAMELISARSNPFGTWGAAAYTQYGNLPLMQLVSVTGIWGPAFLIAWLGSVVNWTWESGGNWALIEGGVLAYVAILLLVLLHGGARLAFAPQDIPTVRVAVIGWPEGMLDGRRMMRVFAADLSGDEKESLRKSFAEIRHWFLESTRREARAGARIVVWPEANAMLFSDDEAAFLESAGAAAREGKAYLLMGVVTVKLGEQKPATIKAVLVNPSGEVSYSYVKSRNVPGFEVSIAQPGDGKIQFADTEVGRLAAAICYDLDFPDLIRQVGRGRADILLAPSSDWRAITWLHPQMAAFRAVENGAALVRPARWGTSLAVDAYGRTLASMDHFAAQDRVMVAQVPIQGVPTLYAALGDAFGWLCVAGLIASIAIAVF